MDGFWHMGFTVKDLDVSIAFYRDVIGMRVDHVMELASEQFDTLTSNQGARTRLAFLTKQVGGTGVTRTPADGTFTLQLWQYDEGGGGEALEPAHNKVGSAHLAFFVEDVEAEYERLRARGDVNITGPLVHRDTSTSFYLADPDGLPIELWEERPA